MLLLGGGIMFKIRKNKILTDKKSIEDVVNSSKGRFGKFKSAIIAAAMIPSVYLTAFAAKPVQMPKPEIHGDVTVSQNYNKLWQNYENSIAGDLKLRLNWDDLKASIGGEASYGKINEKKVDIDVVTLGLIASLEDKIKTVLGDLIAEGEIHLGVGNSSGKVLDCVINQLLNYNDLEGSLKLIGRDFMRSIGLNGSYEIVNGQDSSTKRVYIGIPFEVNLPGKKGSKQMHLAIIPGYRMENVNGKESNTFIFGLEIGNDDGILKIYGGKDYFLFEMDGKNLGIGLKGNGEETTVNASYKF